MPWGAPSSNQSRRKSPDPYDGSYDLTNPQTFNRYAYVQNDPVNLIDPTGLDPNDPRPTTHIDPATGQPTSVPGINAGTVMIDGNGSSSSGIIRGTGIFDGDAHLSLTLINGPGGGNGFGGALANSQNPSTPCTFNINISGVSGQQLTDMQNEISRIFASGNFNVVFGQHAQANAGSMNLVVTPQFTGSLASRNTTVRTLGATLIGSGESQINSTHIFLTTNTTRSIVSRSATFASYGTIYGRVGAHEVITHGFLGTSDHPYSLLRDIRNPSDPSTLRARYNYQWNIGALTAQELRAKCP